MLLFVDVIPPGIVATWRTDDEMLEWRDGGWRRMLALHGVQGTVTADTAELTREGLEAAVLLARYPGTGEDAVVCVTLRAGASRAEGAVLAAVTAQTVPAAKDGFTPAEERSRGPHLHGAREKVAREAWGLVVAADVLAA